MHIRSHKAPCSCFLKKVSLQLSSEQPIGDVRITQFDWKRVPQVRSCDCKSSVAVTAECSRHHASRNVSWLQRVPSASFYTRRQSSAKWRGACPDSNWRTRHATLNLTRSRMGSQWSSCNTGGEMWSLHCVPVISHAVVFSTDCILCSSLSSHL